MPSEQRKIAHSIGYRRAAGRLIPGGDIINFGRLTSPFSQGHPSAVLRLPAPFCCLHGTYQTGPGHPVMLTRVRGNTIQNYPPWSPLSGNTRIASDYTCQRIAGTELTIHNQGLRDTAEDHWFPLPTTLPRCNVESTSPPYRLHPSRKCGNIDAAGRKYARNLSEMRRPQNISLIRPSAGACTQSITHAQTKA